MPNGSLLKAAFYSFQMAVDLNATEGHCVKCSRIAPLPATEQRLRRAKRPVTAWGRGCWGTGVKRRSLLGERERRVFLGERQKARRHSGGSARRRRGEDAGMRKWCSGGAAALLCLRCESHAHNADAPRHVRARKEAKPEGMPTHCQPTGV